MSLSATEMRYAIKAADGQYMGYPGPQNPNEYSEGEWNSDIYNAEFFTSLEKASAYKEVYGIGKWKDAKIVPISITECLPSFEDIINHTYIPLRICFDMDGVIAVIDGEYANRLPFLRTIEIMQKLRNAGHIICIQTARYMFKQKGNQQKADEHGRPELVAWLDKHNVPYDELYFGKVPADIYVDDRGCRVEAAKYMEDWENNFGPLLELTKIKVSQLPTG